MRPSTAAATLVITSAAVLPGFAVPGFTVPGFAVPGLTVRGFTVSGFTVSVIAQTSSGEANGTALDSSGAAIPGATVTLTNQGTNIARTATTNASGNFIFLNLLPGTYVIRVELGGLCVVLTRLFRVGETGGRRDAPVALRRLLVAREASRLVLLCRLDLQFLGLVLLTLLDEF